MSLPKLLDEMVAVLNKLQALDDEANAHWQEQAPAPRARKVIFMPATRRHSKRPGTPRPFGRVEMKEIKERFMKVSILVLSLFFAGNAFGQAQLTLSWDHAVTNQLGFQAERIGNGESRLLEYGATQRSAIDSGLKKNTRYEYRLRALYGEGESEWTNWVKGKTGK